MSTNAEAAVRIGVLLSGDRPHWVPTLIARLESSGDFDHVVVRSDYDEPHSERGFVFRLYEWADARVFGARAMEEVRASRMPLSEHAELGVATQRPEIDVLLWAGPGAAPESLGGAATHAVWWVEHNPDPVEGFLDGAMTVETRLLTHAEPGHVLVLDQVVGRSEPLSLERTRLLVTDATVELLIRNLRRTGALDDETRVRRRRVDRSTPSGHRESAAAARAALRVVRTGALSKARAARYSGHWVVAHRRHGSRALPPTDMNGFTLVPTPTNHDYADPFLVTGTDGRRFIFFEDLPHALGRAHISRVELYPDGTTSPAVCVLTRSYHLSYPLVFSADGDWYMLPETDENRAVELYRAVDFPDRWEFDRTLLANVRAVDTTPFTHDGRTWIFSSTGPADGGLPETLSLYWADTIMSTWHPHPRNPVVADIRGGRSAGRILARDGRLIRPAQDGSRGYGWSLLFNEIVELTMESYRELPIGRIDPGWRERTTRTHHYDADDEFEVVDCHVLVRRARRHRR